MYVCLSVHFCMGACVCMSIYTYLLMSYPHLGVCIMLSPMALVSFAGRAKAEPTRQTTTKRRKRKNSASSANSSVGNANSKKRSPASNFSLSSQVPVSIRSTGFGPLLHHYTYSYTTIHRLSPSYTPIHHYTPSYTTIHLLTPLLHSYYRHAGRKACNETQQLIYRTINLLS